MARLPSSTPASARAKAPLQSRSAGAAVVGPADRVQHGRAPRDVDVGAVGHDDRVRVADVMVEPSGTVTVGDRHGDVPAHVDATAGHTW